MSVPAPPTQPYHPAGYPMECGEVSGKPESTSGCDELIAKDGSFKTKLPPLPMVPTQAPSRQAVQVVSEWRAKWSEAAYLDAEAAAEYKSKSLKATMIYIINSARCLRAYLQRHGWLAHVWPAEICAPGDERYRAVSIKTMQTCAGGVKVLLCIMSFACHRQSLRRVYV